MAPAFKWLGAKLPDGTFDASRVPTAHEKTWWQCPLLHQWEATPGHVGNLGTGCPHCAGRLLPEQRVLMEKLIRARKGNREVAEQAGCSVGYVKKIRARLGVPAPRTVVDHGLIENLIREGKSNNDIVERVGCSVTNVSSLRTRLGIKAPKFDINYALIEKLVREGTSRADIMKLVACGAGAVKRVRRQLGVTTRHRNKLGVPRRAA